MRTLKILSAFSIAGILALSFFAWYSSDDICNRLELARYPVMKMAWLQYVHWDGRSLSIAAFTQLIALKYFPVQITVLIWSASFLCTVIFIFKIIQLENPLCFRGLNPFIAIGILSATLWLGMWKLIPDIIYWSTGGSYSLLNLLGIGWLFIFSRDLKTGRVSDGRKLFIFFLSLVCGINSHNFEVALLTLCLIELARQWIVLKDKKTSVYTMYALAGLLAGTLLVFLAPGNKVRLEMISYPGFSSKFAYYYLLVLAKYCYWLAALPVISFFVLWLTGYPVWFQFKKSRSAIRKIMNSWKEKKSAIILLHEQKYLIAALSTILVFSATSFFAVPRTGIFFGTFIMIWLFQNFINDDSDYSSRRFLQGSKVFLVLFIVIILIQMIQASGVKQQLTLREQVFKNQQGSDVIVSRIKQRSIPFALAFTDISPDTSYWINRCVALNYGLKTVRINGEKEFQNPSK